MSEAEKKWEEFDMTFETTTYAPEASIASREAYKAALRREIEKRIPEKPDSYEEYVIGTRAAMKTILQLLDTVEP